jgi:hypothetical protein
MKVSRWSRGIAPLILNLGTRWRSVQLHTLAILLLGMNLSTCLIGGWVGPSTDGHSDFRHYAWM